MLTKMDILTFPLSPHVLRVSILEAMTGNLLQLQPPITSMWEKTMIELTNMFLWHVRFSKQNTHKHMVSLLHLKMAFLSDRGKKNKTLSFGGPKLCGTSCFVLCTHLSTYSHIQNLPLIAGNYVRNPYLFVQCYS